MTMQLSSTAPAAGWRPSGAALAIAATLAGLAVLPLVVTDAFALDIATRIAAFALAALSLHVLVGLVGLASLGHAMFLGVGAYATVLMAQAGIAQGWLHLIVAALAAAALALLVGLVAIRTTGAQFIMITLAMAQIVYLLAASLPLVGGDDGLRLAARPDYAPLPSVEEPIAFYVLAAGLLGLGLVGVAWLKASRAGLILRGIKSDERRMAALGHRVALAKLGAFTLAGAMAGIAGVLLAQQAYYAGPALMQWMRSGELLIMVIVGGLASVVGPVIGAAAVLLLEEFLSARTVHWQGLLGLFVIAVALRRPLWRQLAGWRR